MGTAVPAPEHQEAGPVPVGAVALVDRGRSDGALLGRGHGARRARHVIVGHHRGPHRLQRAVRGVPPARHKHSHKPVTGIHRTTHFSLSETQLHTNRECELKKWASSITLQYLFCRMRGKKRIKAVLQVLQSSYQ